MSPPASGLAWQEPTPPDPVRALEAAVRRARAASHSRRLDTATQAALVEVAEAAVDLVRIRDRELAEWAKRLARVEGVTFGDP